MLSKLSLILLKTQPHLQLSFHSYFQETENPDCKPLPSIVVCPPTLIGHWVYEVNKFIDKEYLNPLMYAGPPVERVKYVTHY